MEIRPLTAADAAIYREVRLAALREHPTAYCTDYEEEAAFSQADIENRLTPSDAATTFGAFGGERLVGIGTLIRSARLRLAFRATIVGMYVLPTQRRRGVARRLIAACLDRARKLEGVEEVCLSVTCGNDSARRTYLKCGFRPDYVEPRYFKFADSYYDLEWLRLPLQPKA